MSFKKTEMKSGMTLKIKDTFSISDDYKKVLDMIWDEEKKVNDNIFDGQVLYFEKVIGNDIECSFSNYKYWYSQNKLKTNQKYSKICPIAVTGIVKNGNKILLGKRSLNVTQDKGLFDILPSGGISVECNGDYKKQLKQEFKEELAGDPDSIQSIAPLYILEDDKDHVVDIVSIINIENDFDKFTYNKNEYDEIMVMSLTEENFNQIKPKLNKISEFIINDIIMSEKA